MHARRFVATTTCVAVAALGALATAPSAHAEHSAGSTSLAAVLAADGSGFDDNWHDFDILDNAVTTVLRAKPASPVAVLADGEVRLTAFLPTDRAFRKLVGALTGVYPNREDRTFAAVANAASIDTIEAVLLYHVVPGATLTSAKVLKSDNAKLTTALGTPVTVDVTRHPLNIKLVDQDTDAFNANVKLGALDINKGNRQIAHGIDRVLRPVDL